jgi:hypothetical protein
MRRPRHRGNLKSTLDATRRPDGSSFFTSPPGDSTHGDPTMSIKFVVLSSAVAALAVFGSAAATAQSSSVPPMHGYSVVESGPVYEGTSTLSRQQVKAELQQAQREGRLGGGDAAMERALFGNFESTASRAQVRAEAIEARRLGLLDTRGDGEPVVATPAQAESIRQAGLRAIGATTLAAALQ